MSGAPEEFSLIADLFAPMASDFPGAFGLTDDAACMTVPPGRQLVLTMDSMVAGIHFFPDDPADLIARKLIRVNLSDLAAKGAQPFAIMLAASFPQDLSMDWAKRFAAGLAEDCAAYGLSLIGGDTTSTSGPFTASITAFGFVEQGGMVLRSGACPGDRLWTTGSIGDAALGLKIRQGVVSVAGADADYLVDRYLLPQPRIEFCQALAALATASMDVSDGLIQDLGHLCRCSGLAAQLDAFKIPLSAAAAKALQMDQSLLAGILCGGDDYELLFTAPIKYDDLVIAAAAASGVSVSAVGRMVEGRGVRVFNESGGELLFPIQGWRHFNGAGETGASI